MVSKAIRGNCTIWKETEQPFQGHSPVILTIPGFRDMDLGERIVNPKKVDITVKATNAEHETQRDIDEGDWGRWSQKAEEWLLTFHEVHKAEYRDRGQADRMENKTISAPQHLKNGHAHNVRGRELQRRLQQNKQRG